MIVCNLNKNFIKKRRKIKSPHVSVNIEYLKLTQQTGFWKCYIQYPNMCIVQSPKRRILSKDKSLQNINPIPRRLSLMQLTLPSELKFLILSSWEFLPCGDDSSSFSVGWWRVRSWHSELIESHLAEWLGIVC